MDRRDVRGWCLVVLLPVILAGCAFPGVKYEDTFAGLPVVSTINGAWLIASSVRYVPDGTEDLWKEPRDTYADMTGDCEDMSALFLAIVVKSRLGNGYIAGIRRNEGTVLHAVAEINGVLYESQIYGMYWPSSSLVEVRYSLDEYVQHKALEGG
jgi:hypothetical protein